MKQVSANPKICFHPKPSYPPTLNFTDLTPPSPIPTPLSPPQTTGGTTTTIASPASSCLGVYFGVLRILSWFHHHAADFFFFCNVKFAVTQYPTLYFSCLSLYIFLYVIPLVSVFIHFFRLLLLACFFFSFNH